MSDPGDPGRVDPSMPRPSQRASGATAGRQPSGDPVVEQLLAYVAATDIPPAASLASRIQARVAQEPAQTPSRRFVVALVALSPGRAWAAFRQAAGAAFGRGSFPAAVRVQALALMLVTVLAVGALGAGGAIGLDTLVRRPDQPAPTVPPNVVPATLLPTASPVVTPSLVSPSPSGNLTGHEPGPTPSASQPPTQGTTSTPAPLHTPAPDVTPRSTHRPGPTPTPRPTHTPLPTPRPPHTPRPTETPEPTETTEPTDPPETPRPPHTPRPTARPTPRATRTPRPTDIPYPTQGDSTDGHGGSVWLAAVWALGGLLLGGPI